MLFNKTVLLAGACCLAMTGAAAAQNYDTPEETTGPYIAGGYNYLDFNQDLGGSADVHAFTARAGWQFIPYLSAEGEVSFGIDNGDFDFDGSEDDFDFDDNSDGDLNDVISGPGELGMDYLIGLFGRATLPVSDRFDVFARAGYAFAELDSTIQTGGGNEIEYGGSEDGFAFGGGAAYDLTENLAIRADYTHYEFDTANAESIGASLEVKF